MRTPAIVPTITQRVRLLLAEQGAALRPWAGLQETYDELYALLRRRRGEPEFWQPLKGLLQEVIASAADSQRSGRKGNKAAELLDSWQVDDLVDELRAALPEDAAVARTDFTRTLSTAVLGGFLLLGLAAAGCGGDTNEGGTGGTGGSLGSGGHSAMAGGAYGAGGVSGGVGGVAGASLTGAGGVGSGGAGGARLDGSVDAASGGAGGGTATGGAGGGGGAGGMDAAGAIDVGLDGAGGARVDGARGETPADWAGEIDTQGIDGNGLACVQNVAPELDRTIGGSSLSTAEKSKLCGCFSVLSSSWTSSLTDLFATATPTEIASMLKGILPCCSTTVGITGRNGSAASPSSGNLSDIENGRGYMLCSAPTYKGVSFPD